MNVNIHDLGILLRSHDITIRDIVERALQSCADHHRPSTVTLTFTAKRDRKAPGVVVLESQIKAKEPKSDKTDLSAKSDKAELGRWEADEEPGQQRIDD